MTALFQVVDASLKVWGLHPLEFIVAALVGVIVGYLLSRLRHQGTIQAQDAHLKTKDEVIKMKDAAIASLSSPRPVPVSIPGLSPGPNPPDRLPHDPETSRATFSDQEIARARAVARQIEAHLRKTVVSTRYQFIFNPMSGQSKFLTFKPDGAIGEGRNDNEHHWRVNEGVLEIFNSKGELYSRFVLLHDMKSLHHTNDPDTRSIKGQYMVPLSSIHKPR